MNNNSQIAFALLFSLFLFSGCAHQLKVDAEQDPLVDRSGVNQPQIDKESYERVLILPPDVRAIGEFSETLAIAERQFLKNNITVIDPSALGDLRELMERDLSTLELAVKAGKKKEADGVIVTGRYEYLPASSDFGLIHGRRYFRERDGLEEIDRKTFEVTPDEEKFWLSEKTLHYEGKLVDVENGRVNASFDIYVPFANIINPYEATIEIDPEYSQNHQRTENNYRWGGTAMEQELEIRANEYLFDRIVRHITNQESPAP